MMLERSALEQLTTRLETTPAVALLGPRQVGKTTLALLLAEQRPTLYLDLQLDADRARLTDPAPYLRENSDKLIILDEIHRTPDLFTTLRSVIDSNRRDGKVALVDTCTIYSTCIDLLG